MEAISKKNLANLLNDLYDIFNPDHKMYVDSLVERNINMPLDAVDMILLKYNHPNLPFHDPAMSSNDYQMKLVADYAKGIRPLRELDISKRKAELRSLEEKEKEEKVRAEKEREIELEKKIREQQSEYNQMSEKEIQHLQEKMNSLIKELEDIREKEKNKSESNDDDDVEHKIRVNYTEQEIILPNAKKIKGLGIGARLIVKSKEGKPVGLVVKDITYDDISHPEGKTMIDIILDKG